MFRLDLWRIIAFDKAMLKLSPLLAGLAASLVACTSTPSQPASPDNAETQQSDSATQQAMNKTSSGIGAAATAPLKDFNLRRDKIPPLLRTIRNPYALDSEIECEEIARRVEALNAILGRDWDIPPPDKASLRARAADGASTAFLDTVASEASGLIPYRGVVRTVSGANRHASKVRKAYERGSHRRTFLKGVGQSKGCAAPAAPAHMAEEPDMVVFK